LPDELAGNELADAFHYPLAHSLQSSRGKLDNLHSTPAEFTATDFDGYGFCYLSLTRPAGTASYPVSVRQVTALLHASLAPCLATTLLRFANTSPPSGCVEDLTSARLCRGLTSKLPNMLGTVKKAISFVLMATGSYYDFFKSKRLLKAPAKQRRRPDLISERGLLLQTLLNH
jgi:hypothetical protein